MPIVRSDPGVTVIFATAVLSFVSGSCGVPNGALGETATVDVPVTVDPPAAIIFPTTFPRTELPPEGIGPATLQVITPAELKHPAGTEVTLKPVGTGMLTTRFVAASGPALLTAIDKETDDPEGTVDEAGVKPIATFAPELTVVLSFAAVSYTHLTLPTILLV